MIFYYTYRPHPLPSKKHSISLKIFQKSHTIQLTGKSQLYYHCPETWDSAAHDPTLNLTTGNIKYLGITVSPRLSELFNLNYTPLLKKIEDDYKRWNKLPLTLIGRIAAVKMKTLPQIIYLFSMIPTTPTAKWFKTLDSLTTHFYWKDKKNKNCTHNPTKYERTRRT